MENEAMIQVKETFFDISMGFASLVTTDGLEIQCCVEGEYPDYEKAIVKSDCGADTGICKDVNQKAFEKYGEDTALELLFTEAKKAGFKVRN